MRQAALLKQPRNSRRKLSGQVSLTSPVGGLNSRDSIADMKPEDAIQLDNWFPGTSDIRVRRGYSSHATGLGAQVQSLMAYNKSDGTQKLYAAAGTSIFNVTNAGAVGSAEVTSLSNAIWHHVNYMDSSGTNWLCCFNGTDQPRYHNGSAWVTITASSTPAITNVTTSLLDKPFTHKRRLWAVEKNSLSCWYLPADGVGGGAAEINLNGIVKRGGKIIKAGSWTIDAGEGLDDYWVAITSEGEVVVFEGTDPSAAATFSLVGVWHVGEPIGDRPMVKYGGDLLILTKQGVYPMSKALSSSEVAPNVAMTDKIQSDINSAATSFSGNFGWELFLFPKAEMLILNIPEKVGSDQIQYAMNTLTGAWGKFTNIEANCWELFGGDAYFGSNGKVFKFWSQDKDDTSNINAEAKQAFSYFGSRGLIKHFKMIRPILLSDGNPSFSAALNVDYEDVPVNASLTFSPITGGVWDAARWDAGLWGGDLAVIRDWQTLVAVGTAAALRLQSQSGGTTNELRWEATDFLYEVGDVL